MQDILNAIKEQIDKLSDGGFNLEIYVLVFGAVILFAFILSSIINFIHGKRQEKRYIENFKREFTGNIRTTLQALEKDYRKGTDMWYGINKALFYLDHSIRRDYAGALWYIEQVLESNKVEDLHKEYLCKIPIIYSLPNKC